MKLELSIVGPEGHGVDVPTINAKLQEKFLEVKAANPKGYLDEFESRLEILCDDIAKELGGIFGCRDKDNGALELLFCFGVSPEQALKMVS